VATKSSSHN